MFKIRRLEDRIVLDGAAVLETIDQIHQQEEYSQLIQDFNDQTDGHHAHDMLHGDFFNPDDNPLHLPDLIGSDNADDGAHVLVISSDVKQGDDLAAAAKDNVIVVRYDASSTTLNDLAKMIDNALDGKKADSIAFATHTEQSGQLSLVDSAATTADSIRNDAGQMVFWENIGKLLDKDGRIDLLACNLSGSADGDAVVSGIENAAGANVAASDDLTGNEAYGGDWTLESDGIDIHSTYFDTDKLGHVEGTLAALIPNYIPIQTLYGTEPLWTFNVANYFTDLTPATQNLYIQTGAPTWATFNQLGGSFSGSNPQPGTWNITIKVYDTPDYAMSQTTFTLTVNTPPQLIGSLANQTVAQNSAFNYDTDLSTVFYDPDVTPMVFTTTRPAWMSFDYANQRFYGTPTLQSDVGTFNVGVVAYDSVTWVSRGTQFTVTVLNTNDQPIVSDGIPNQSINQGSTLNFVLPATAFSDPDGDVLTYTPSGMPGWMSFNSGTRTFYGTPVQESDNVSTLITVRAQDPSATWTQTTFTMTVVNVNSPPYVNLPIPNQTATQHLPFSFTPNPNTFIDPDGTSIIYTSPTHPGWLSFNQVTQNFYGTPNAQTDVTTASVTLRAYDSVNWAYTDTTFQVTVNNVNDPPVVNQGIPAQSVSQFATFSYAIPGTAFTDVDGDTMTYTASGMPGWMSFNGLTFTGRPVNQSDVTTTLITVTAADPSLTSVSTTFNMTVVDVNEPVIVSQGLTTPQTVNQGAAYTYAIPSNTFSDPDGTTILVTVAGIPAWMSFNNVTNTLYGTPTSQSDVGGPITITVRGYDSVSWLSATTQFSLTVNDVNSQAPVMTPAGPWNIAENVASPTLVGSVTSTDADTSGETPTYSFAYGNESNYFNLNPVTGQITVTAMGDAAFDFESGVTSWVLGIQAFDTLFYSSVVNYTIRLTDVNDTAPIMSTVGPFTFTVMEQSASGTNVFQTSATDPDTTGQTINYSIVSGNVAGYFNINTVSGQVTVATAGQTGLNFETGTTTYVLGVQASDGTNSSAVTNYTVNLVDANDNIPVMQPAGPFSVVENSLAGTSIGFASATDADAASTLVHYITSGNTNSYFAINWSTGAITVATAGTALNYEGAQTRYVLGVNVFDGVRIGTPGLYTINVTDANDLAPVLQPGGPFTVAENPIWGAAVGAVSATDQDTVGGPTTYSIVSGTGLGLFDISLNTGAITVSLAGTALNFEATSTYTVGVLAGDGLNASSVVNYTINLTDVNDMPPVIQPGVSATIFESATAGSALGIFATATDPDTPNTGLTYFIVSGNSEGYFSINGSTGQIGVATTASPFDYETLTTRWTLGVRAFDGVAQSSDAFFTISLVNVNDTAPVMVSGGPYTVFESPAVSTTVGFASATDADNMGPLTYSIVSGDAGSYFQITSAGMLQVSSAGTRGLDYETPPTQYVIGVRASDGVNTSVTMSYTVNLVGRDDNAPILQPTGPFTLLENATAGQFIGAVTATDVDSPAANISYSIFSGNTNNYFALNTSSGAITLTAAGQTALDYETKPFYTLAITATDGINPVNPPRVYQINMVNVDDQAPVMQPGGPFNVAENTGAGVTVAVVSATDADTPQGSLTYAILSGNTNSWFQISATGQISPTAAGVTALDYELGTSYRTYALGIYAGDGVRTSALSNYTINLTNVNDAAPVMTSTGPFSFTIPESTAQGVTIFTAQATDVDSAVMTYQITSGNGAGYFQINPTSGVVSLTAAGDAAMNFDPPGTSSYVLSVRATDGINASSAIDYTINLSDVNDNAPVMVAATAPFTIMENLTSLASFGTVSATDADSPPVVATFVIASGNTNNYFAINASTGDISLTNAAVGRIDYDAGPTSYVLGIRAVDGVNPATPTLNYTINLVNANDSAPVMQAGGPFTVSEVSPIATVVGNLSATDADGTAGLTYSIVSGNTASYFAMTNNQIVLNVAATGTNLDFESATKAYVLGVNVTDGIYTSSAMNYTVNLVDANDNPPVMQARPPIALSETAVSGTTVATVAATDLDTVGGPISYVIDSGNGLNYFAINAATGAITVTPAGDAGLDFETLSTFTLGIYATDTVNTSAIVNYTINLTDVNESAPMLYSAGPFSIFETAVQGDFVGAVSAIDPDSTGERTTYSIVSGNAAGYFTIDAVTGNIMVSVAGGAGLEFDPVATATTRYVLGVRATDGTFQSSVVSYTVNLVDVNDTAPVMTTAGPFTLAENSVSGVVFANVTSTDVDTTNNAPSFSIITGNGNNYFALNATTGELSLTAAGSQAIDYESGTTRYVLGIMATDGANNSSTVNYTINLVNVNDTAPVLLAGGPFTVADEAAAGTPVSTISKTDADNLPGPVTYAIVSGTGSNFFSIDASGQIAVNAAAGTNLDFDTVGALTRYTLGVQATDGPNTSATVTYTINVRDLNDEAPVMQANGPFTIPERSAVNTQVGLATAIDPDTTGQVPSYSITTGNGAGFFAINSSTGAIRVAASGLDFETVSTYVLGIQATDGVNLSSAINYTINLSNVNDTAPVMIPAGPFTVFENAGFGYAVGTASATDADNTGGNPSYTIVSGNQAGLFEINASTGAITTTMAASYSLDFDSPPTTYVLGVQASDGANLSATQNYTINLRDVNDLKPVMVQGGPFSVFEAQSGVTVATVAATDADTTGETLTFSIVSGTGSAFFTISSSGQITTAGTTLDYESGTRSYTLGIQATDGVNTSTAAVYVVNLADINDNAPVMVPKTPFTLSEDAAQGVVVGWASATDVDTVGGPIGYVLQYGDPSGHFTVNPNTGQITVSAMGAAQLDYDTLPTSYTLGISASDGLNSSAIVEYTINLTDVNDTPPVVQTAAAFSVAETAVRDTLVGQVSATDVDTTGESTYYAITSGNTAGYFRIDTTTGNIFVTAAGDSGLNFESGTTSYVLGITANDGVNYSTPVPYTINLLDINDETPVMTPEGPFTLAENAGSVVFADVTSTDADVTVVAPTYSIVTGNLGNYFQIDTSSGQLSLTAAGTAAMDYELGQTRFVLGIRASDGVNSSPIVNYTINLVDSNDTAPVMTAAGPFTLAEETPAGNVVATVMATDADTTHEPITYAIVSGTGSSFFAIPALDGVITVDAAAGTYLDFELTATTSYTVGVMAGDGVNTSAVLMYTINLVNVNDEAPVMQTAGPFTLFESAVGGAVIGMATATDADGIANPLTYEIQSGNVPGYFAINSSTGRISLTTAGNALDFESGTTQYVIGVRAYDGAQWGSAIDYTIQLVDVNDTAPVMTPATPFTIFEDRSVMTPLGNVTSTDLDTTGELPTYIIQSGNNNGYFSINASSGELSLTSVGIANIDFESGITSYVLGISATDGVNPSSVQNYTINLVDVNDTAPVMGAGGPFTVFENAGTGGDVGTVSATDMDKTGETLSYSIISGDPNSYFSVNVNTGLIEVTAAGATSLDFESATRSFTLGIVASDGLNTSVSGLYTINLVDANDQAPIMQSGAAYTIFTIPENRNTGFVVGTVTATDPDSTGQTVSYYIGARNDSGRFQLNATTGQISVSSIGGAANGLNFDAPGPTTYTLGIYATDGTNTSTIIDFTINLSDVNDLPPTVTTSPILTVNERATRDTLVGQASATDPDTTGDMTYYSIASGNTNSYFWIDSTTGNIFVSAAGATGLDFESGTTQYVLGIRANDGVNNSSVVGYTINLNNINDVAPVMIPQTAPFTVVEAHPGLGLWIGSTVTSTDIDSVGPFTYTIVSGNVGSIFGFLTPNDGQLTAVPASPFDFESGTTQYVIGVQATDGANISTVQNYTINIVDVNDTAPVMTPAGPFSMIEQNSALAGTPVAIVSATDADTTGQTLTFIEATGTGSAYFDVSASGEIRVAAGAGTWLDSESGATSYTLGIQASDGTNTGAVQMYTINITNINDTAPVMQPSGPFTIPEGSPLGTPVGRATATDADQLGQTLVYTIQSGNGNNYFAINSTTGQLSVTSAGTALNYEGVSSYVLGISASDGTLNSSAVNYTITLSNVNDQAPVMVAQAPFTVFEMQSSGAVVIGTASATDPDNMGEIPTYTIVSGNSAGFFQIGSTSGAITVGPAASVGMDFEAGPTRYVIGVMATDAAEHSSAVQNYTINLVNVNDSTPVMQAGGPFTVFEAQSGLTVATVAATDADGTGQTLSFSIVSGTGSAFFNVGANTGLVTTAGTALDYESVTKSYTLGIQATDGVNTSTTVTYVVNLTDRNDNAPIMTPGGPFTVSESAVVNTTVTTIMATDADTVGAARTYQIVSGNTNGYFDINPTTGQVYVTTVGDLNLNFEGVSTYTLGIRAYDGANYSSSVDYTINLTNADDVAPVLGSAGPFSIPEDLFANGQVGTVTASDVDTPLGSLSYSIVSGDTGGFFYVNNEGGVAVIRLTTAGDAGINYDSATTRYVLGLRATDGPRNSAIGYYTINLTNVNDVAPVMQPQAALTVFETTAASATFGTVSATDADSAAPFTYSIVSGNLGGYFQINATSGALSVSSAGTGNLDYDFGLRTYVLGIRATDGVNAGSVVNYTVNLRDANDIAPVMTLAGPFTVAENRSAGSSIATVVATDVDTTGPATSFSLVSGTGSNYFAVNSATGEITVTAAGVTALNYELGTAYRSFTLGIAGRDGVQTGATVTYTINLVDSNDQAPVMVSGGPYSINENAPIGTLVFDADSSDGDTVGNSPYYSIVSGNTSGSFSINSNTGVVQTVRVFNYEGGTTSWVLGVQAFDGVNTSATTLYTINLNNVNDVAPVVTAQPAPFTVSEALTTMRSLGFVTATDADTPTANLSYLIGSGNTNGYFAINSSTGEITLTAAGAVGIDYESGTTRYTLGIQATDGTNVSAVANYAVNVVNANDVAPLMSAAGPFTLSESAAAGAVVANVTATDVDTAAGLTFAIVSGDPASYFTIGAATGQITVTAAGGAADPAGLNYDGTGQRVYVLGIRSGDGVQAGATAYYTVNLTDANDNAPVLTGPTAVTTSQDYPLNTLIADMNATDVDTTGQQITFGISSTVPVGSRFYIDSFNGEIRTNGTLAAGVYTLNVIAGDGTNTTATYPVTVTVQAGQLTNHPPVVSAPIVDTSVSEPGVLNPSGTWYFALPAGTFTDPDVGATLTLSARIVGGAGTPVSDGSLLPGSTWIRFDTHLNAFYGDVPDVSSNTPIFIEVFATDQFGGQVRDEFVVTILASLDSDMVQALSYIDAAGHYLVPEDFDGMGIQEIMMAEAKAPVVDSAVNPEIAEVLALLDMDEAVNTDNNTTTHVIENA